MSIIPARPRKPRDKAPVERAVQLVERWIMFRLRKVIFTSLADLNSEIRRLLVDLNNRTMKRVGKSRAELFQELERPALQPLPIRPYEYAEFALARVTAGYHFTFDQHEYSVPFQLINQQMKVRATADAVEAYFNGKRVASHPRSRTAGGVTTDPAHRDRKHAAYIAWNREEALRQAGGVGPACREFLECIGKVEKHIRHEQRAAIALQKMARQFGPERVEVACRRALSARIIKSTHVLNLLRNNREALPLRINPEAAAVIVHKNLRNSEQFTAYLKSGAIN